MMFIDNDNEIKAVPHQVIDDGEEEEEDCLQSQQQV